MCSTKAVRKCLYGGKVARLCPWPCHVTLNAFMGESQLKNNHSGRVQLILGLQRLLVNLATKFILAT